ncbi:hypothetical protein [Mucilaginibacter celer]|uniref:Uncharacterized protein n=1 Tax=Mucilaginibacter celer TaxID=2305508 RepID=A0A494VS93_9SPHI|nr:hypothetical protein [Mucilaginibacter celer]AYL94248.1 hypothetical protein HYN43_002590 [Mucilaginibacter celer]
MKTLLLSLILLLNTIPNPPTTVYICSGAKGKKYHLRNDCRGLSHCQHRVLKMSLSDAEKDGRTLCGFEK